MSYLRSILTTPDDNGSVDAFQRLRVSEAVTIFDSQFQYDLQPLLWEISNTGSSTVTHLSAQASAYMTTTTTGDYAILQTKQYHRYQPGKSNAVFATFSLLSSQPNTVKQVGLFDNENGIFLQSTATGYQLVRRSSASGSVVDETVSQSNWNVDKMDGSGISGITLDFTKDQIFVIDLQWLGVGRVRCGFDVDGRLYYVHDFKHANRINTVYMTTANLPVRYALSANGPAQFQPICCAVVSEAGFETERGLPFSASLSATPISVNADNIKYHVLSIKKKLTFNGLVNHGQIVLENLDQLANALNTAIYYEVLYNATFSTVPTYLSVDPNSIMEYAVGDGTRTVTGGTVIDSGYLAGSRVTSGIQLQSKLPLSLSINGLSADNLTVAARRVANVNTPFYASLSWKELR
jgi:hypothetical protein